jgi:hypothetical protein
MTFSWLGPLEQRVLKRHDTFAITSGAPEISLSTFTLSTRCLSDSLAFRYSTASKPRRLHLNFSNQPNRQSPAGRMAAIFTSEGLQSYGMGLIMFVYGSVYNGLPEQQIAGVASMPSYS